MMRGLENRMLRTYNAYVTIIVFKLAKKHLNSADSVGFFFH